MKEILLVVLVASAYASASLPRQYDTFIDHVQRHFEASHFEFKSLAAESDDELVKQLSMLETVMERSLFEDIIKNLLEDFRDIVINGNENLPPLDPLKVDHLGPFAVTATGIRATANIYNLNIEGLRWFVIDDVSFNALRLTLGVHVTLPWLTVTGSYDAQARLALLLTHKAGGNFRIFVNRLEVGVDLRLGTNILAGHLTLRELDIKIDIHDTLIQIDGMTGSTIINNFISNLVQSITQDVIQSEVQNLGQLLSDSLFEPINEILKDFTLNDILG
ncbi:uncharacterized protein ACR2FA_012356 [Aphomia sociella]